MSVKVVQGDIFKAPVQTLVNATNDQGVMGSGIAKAFKDKYPAMYVSYRWMCEEGYHDALHPHYWRGIPYASHNVLNICTMRSIKRGSSQFGAAHSVYAPGLAWLVNNYREKCITSIALPALGCGIGGLDWKEVRPIMEAFLGLLAIPVYIYEPH